MTWYKVSLHDIVIMILLKYSSLLRCETVFQMEKKGFWHKTPVHVLKRKINTMKGLFFTLLARLNMLNLWLYLFHRWVIYISIIIKLQNRRNIPLMGSTGTELKPLVHKEDIIPLSYVPFSKQKPHHLDDMS